MVGSPRGRSHRTGSLLRMLVAFYRVFTTAPFRTCYFTGSLPQPFVFCRRSFGARVLGRSPKIASLWGRRGKGADLSPRCYAQTFFVVPFCSRKRATYHCTVTEQVGRASGREVLPLYTCTICHILYKWEHGIRVYFLSVRSVYTYSELLTSEVGCLCVLFFRGESF